MDPEMTMEPMPTFLGTDFDDDDRAVALLRLSEAGSDEVSDDDMFTGGELGSMVTTDDLLLARAGKDYEWDWGMTPSQRAAKIADNSFASDMAAFVDRYSDLAVDEPVDPEEFAERVMAERYGRRYGNG